MKSYRAAFKKKDGDLREMHFVKLSDLPKQFVSDKMKGNNKKHVLQEGMELVWDLQAKGFRIFNWNTVEGVVIVTEEEVDFVV